jgi:hypothetical protein
LEKSFEELPKFARGGAVRKFQRGGLAEVGMPIEEEEETVEALPAEEIVERTVNPGAGKSLTELILGNKQSAINRLKETRTNLATRRQDQIKREERDRWLALAQAMLAPTRTGAFGESLGSAAGLLREESQQAAESAAMYDQQLYELTSAEMAAESDMIDQMIKLTGTQNANRAKGIHGAIQTMVKPEDRGKPIAQQELVFGAMELDNETGEWGMKPLKDPNGGYFIAADRLEPARAAALMKAAETAELQTGRQDQFINDAYGVGQAVKNVRRAMQLFEEAPDPLNTSGVTEWRQKAQEFFNIDFGDKTELSELQNIIAQDYLQKLENLKGNTSDRDVMIMKGISLGLGRDADANYIQLQKMAKHYESMIVRGIRAAYEQTPPDMNAVADLWPNVGNVKFIPGAKPMTSEQARNYDKLEPGAYFLQDDWGGKIYIKADQPEE